MESDWMSCVRSQVNSAFLWIHLLELHWQLGSALPDGARGTAGGAFTVSTFQTDLNEPLWFHQCQCENISSEVICVNSPETNPEHSALCHRIGTVAWLLIYLKKRKTTTKNVARKLNDYQETLTKETVLSRVCKASKQIHYFLNTLFVILTAYFTILLGMWTLLQINFYILKTF